MPESDLLYRIALGCVPGIGPVYTKKLLEHFGDAKAIFHARSTDLRGVKGMGKSRVNAIRRFNQFPLVEKEMAFMDKYGIRCLFYKDKDYPHRLATCDEAPVMLFYLGNTDLNFGRVVSIVGTRSPTDYGRLAAARLIRDLAANGPLVISGLAYGIDTVAHKTALDNSLSTVAILGHGLDRIYPPENKSLAAKMIGQGGLLTNFLTHSENSPHNFPLRNRIVAGMCDALIVVETDTDGGSMLTVKNASSYKKQIFAIPGRLTDKTSSGCNQLIQRGIAKLLLNGSQLIAEMGWDLQKTPPAKQAALFKPPIDDDLSDDEKFAIRLLHENEQLALDDISARINATASVIALTLFNLEMRGLIRALPGKRYRLAV